MYLAISETRSSTTLHLIRLFAFQRLSTSVLITRFYIRPIISMRKATEAAFFPPPRSSGHILKLGGVCYISVPYGARHSFGWYQVFDSLMVKQIVDVFG